VNTSTGNNKLSSCGNKVILQTNLGGPSFKELLPYGNHLVIGGLERFFPETQLKSKVLFLIL
jgi:hypothetical protein